jgi:hypothetical protein
MRITFEGYIEAPWLDDMVEMFGKDLMTRKIEDVLCDKLGQIFTGIEGRSIIIKEVE